MTRAIDQLEGRRTGEALPHEMAALQGLLQAQAEVRRREVAQQAGASMGGLGRQGQDLSALFDKELQRQQRTNYETRSQTETRADRQESESALDRIRDLARRQEELSRRQRELANAAPSGGGAEAAAREADAGAGGASPAGRGAGAPDGPAGRPAAAWRIPQPIRPGAARCATRPSRCEALRRAAAAVAGDRRGPGRACGGRPPAARTADAPRQPGGAAARRRRGAPRSPADRRRAAAHRRRGGPAREGRRRGERRCLEAALRARKTSSPIASMRCSERPSRLAGTDKPSPQGVQRGQPAAAAREIARQQIAGRMRETRQADARRERRRRRGWARGQARASARSGRGRTADCPGPRPDRRSTGRRARPVPRSCRASSTRRARCATASIGSNARCARPTPETAAGRQGQGRATGGTGGRRHQPGGNPEPRARGAAASRAVREGTAGRARIALPARARLARHGTRRGDAPSSTSGVAVDKGTEAFKQDFSKWESLRKDVDSALDRYEASVIARAARKSLQDRLSAGGSDRVPDDYRRLIARYYESLARKK